MSDFLCIHHENIALSPKCRRPLTIAAHDNNLLILFIPEVLEIRNSIPFILHPHRILSPSIASQICCICHTAWHPLSVSRAPGFVLFFISSGFSSPSLSITRSISFPKPKATSLPYHLKRRHPALCREHSASDLRGKPQP